MKKVQKAKKETKRVKIRKNPLFNPTEIITSISVALNRDLSNAATEYGIQTGAFDFYRRVQGSDFLKKFADPSSHDETLRGKTFQKFLDTNEHMGRYTARFLNLPYSNPHRDSHAHMLAIAKHVCHTILTPLSEEEWFLGCRNTGGTSWGVSYNDTSIESKMSYPISCTKRVIRLTEKYLSEYDVRLSEAIVTHNKCIGNRAEVFEVVRGSRSTTVPKTNKIDRMIAIEPTWNMFFQQGLMQAMYSRLKRFGLDVETLPERHKMLAQRGSISGNLATIDFSSASDCLSYDLVKWLLPPAWFSRLDMVRCPETLLNGSWVKLNMFSTMGNAGTFPLETLLFYALGVAATTKKNLKPGYDRSCFYNSDAARQVSVFGDDVIMPTTAVPLFRKLTRNVGFIINEEKSFFDSCGGFRESCGGDYYHGVDVRPICIKGPTNNKLSSLEPWLYIIGNLILKKYMSYFGSRNYLYDRRVFSQLLVIFQKYRLTLKIVPQDFPDDAGLKIASDFERFLSCYPFQLHRIGVDKHGTVNFAYCSYRYKETRSMEPSLRYALTLKMLPKKAAWTDDRVFRHLPFFDILLEGKSMSTKVINSKFEFDDRYHTRKRGSYVVARTSTLFWR